MLQIDVILLQNSRMIPGIDTYDGAQHNLEHTEEADRHSGLPEQLWLQAPLLHLHFPCFFFSNF
jgi:hypothetical protein